MIEIENNARRFRKLVGDERKFLWNPLTNVTLVTRIKGEVSEHKLRNAINKVKKAHPLLSSRVVFGKDNTAWFHNDHFKDLPLRVVQLEHEDQWQDELMYENRIPFKISTGPLIRFVLMKSTQSSDFMVFCQHSICDGRSLIYLVRDILSLIAEPDKEIILLKQPPLLSSEGISSYVSKKSFRSKIRSYIINKINAKWRKDIVTFDQEDFENIHKAFWKDHKCRFEFLELTEEQTSKLVKKCRDNKVTVTSALSVAFLAAYFETIGPFKGRQQMVSLPVDLRNHMRESVGDVFCLYINRIILKFNYSSKIMFWENVNAFHEIATKEFESVNLFESFLINENMEPTLLDAMNFGTLAKSVPKDYSRYEKLSNFASSEKNIAVKLSKKFENLAPGLVLTNLGVANISDKYGNMQIEKMFFAPSTDERFPLLLGAVTVAGKLVLSINYFQNSREDNIIKIRDRAKNLLKL